MNIIEEKDLKVNFVKNSSCLPFPAPAGYHLF